MGDAVTCSICGAHVGTPTPGLSMHSCVGRLMDRDPAALMRAEKEMERNAEAEEFGPVNLNSLEPDALPRNDVSFMPGDCGVPDCVSIVKHYHTNGAGIDRAKLRQSPGRPKGARNLNAKHPSSISKAFAKAGLDWKVDFALAIKANNRARIKLWLRLLPYLVTTTNRVRVRKWRGKASKAAMIALEALENGK